MNEKDAQERGCRRGEKERVIAWEACGAGRAVLSIRQAWTDARDNTGRSASQKGPLAERGQAKANLPMPEPLQQQRDIRIVRSHSCANNKSFPLKI